MPPLRNCDRGEGCNALVGRNGECPAQGPATAVLLGYRDISGGAGDHILVGIDDLHYRLGGQGTATG